MKYIVHLNEVFCTFICNLLCLFVKVIVYIISAIAGLLSRNRGNNVFMCSYKCMLEVTQSASAVLRYSVVPIRGR